MNYKLYVKECTCQHTHTHTHTHTYIYIYNVGKCMHPIILSLAMGK